MTLEPLEAAQRPFGAVDDQLEAVVRGVEPADGESAAFEALLTAVAAGLLD
ncbi:hypothetical protein [Allosphingosinicella sp.]|jgi:hypothetical protein|uniref:hypothetical protein n=1 Tax=Allosphingosinicella sp. TaxID=2823234 RepID=UPI002EDE6FEB